MRLSMLVTKMSPTCQASWSNGSGSGSASNPKNCAKSKGEGRMTLLQEALAKFIYLVICVLQCSIRQRHYKAREDKKRLAAMTEEEVAKQIEESEKHAGLSLSVAAAAAAASLTVRMIEFPFDTQVFQFPIFEKRIMYQSQCGFLQ